MKNENLERIVSELPLIKQLFKYDVYLTVMDAEGIVQGFSVPDGVEPALHVGDPFQDPSGAFQEVIRTGNVKHNRLPKEVMGEAFEGILAPIKDGREVVGCIICTYSTEMKEETMRIAVKFQESMHSVNESIQSVVARIGNLAAMLNDMSETATNVEGDVQAAVDVVGKISDNASRSNILALNASIEAARSGEYGRGFSVVATQMGQLAKDSGSSATDIKATLADITEHLISMVTSMKEANEIAKKNRNSISEIQDILENSIMLAEKLEKNAEK